MATRAEAPPNTGWAIFAGIVLVLIGAFNIVDGLAALFQDQVFVATRNGLIVGDFTAWGWVHLLFGIFLVLAGLGLFSGAGWARWTAVFLAGLNAIAQVVFITAFPLWSILIIALDVMVIYQLTARWVPVEGGLLTPQPYDSGPTAARDQMTRIGTGLG